MGVWFSVRLGAKIASAKHFERYHDARRAMYAGIMQKLNALRALLERSGESMTDSNHLAAYILKIKASELGTATEELSEHRCSLTTDGTRRAKNIQKSKKIAKI